MFIINAELFIIFFFHVMLFLHSSPFCSSPLIDLFLALYPLHFWSILSSQSRHVCSIYLDRLSKRMRGGNLIADLPFGTKKSQLMTKKCIHNRNVGIWTSLQHVHHLFSAMDLTWIHILFSRRLPCVRPDSVKHIISVFFSSYNAKHICYCNRLFEEHDSVLSKLCDCIISI